MYSRKSKKKNLDFYRESCTCLEKNQKKYNQG